MDKLLYWGVALIGLIGIFSIPSDFLLGYAEWVKKRHGPIVQIGMTILLTLEGVVVTLTWGPHDSPLLDVLSYILFLLWIVVVGWDCLQFWRTNYGNTSRDN